jgi:hypothetical protein
MLVFVGRRRAAGWLLRCKICCEGESYAERGCKARGSDFQAEGSSLIEMSRRTNSQ